jgi:hypothetical protein
MSKETETTAVQKAEASNPTLKSVAKYKRGQNVEYKVFIHLAQLTGAEYQRQETSRKSQKVTETVWGGSIQCSTVGNAVAGG